MLEFENDLASFECALSNGTHLSKNGILLRQCGHSACKRCVDEKNNFGIKCGICGLTSRFKKTDQIYQQDQTDTIYEGLVMCIAAKQVEILSLFIKKKTSSSKILIFLNL